MTTTPPGNLDAALPELHARLLDPDAPLRSLRALHPDVSHRAHGAAREPPVSDVAVVSAERGGNKIQVSTLAAYARALGYLLVLGVEPEEPAEVPATPDP